MKIQCILKFDYENNEDANYIADSVKVDDYIFVTTKVENCAITSVINSDSISSLIHTLDDYMACIALAEQVIEKIPKN